MAIAGRILIMPKGNYDESATYEMLDLVSHNGISWLAKKTVTGIEPSEANSEYWHNMLNLNIVNNLEAAEEGSVLDAKQGKVLNDRINKMEKFERFELVSPKEGVINFIRQNCYKAGNRVHIEFSATATEEMLSSEAWALIPSEYAPTESTGYTGIFMFYNDGVRSNVCGCYALPPSDDSNYSEVYQSVDNIPLEKYVGFMFDYYLN